MSNLFLRTVALVDTTSYPLFSGEAWAQAGKTTLLGMAAVFAVLTIIMLVVMLMGKIFGKEAAPKAAEAAPAPIEEVTETASDEEEIAAAIIAAISAYRANEEGTTGAFRVVSFRKANTKSSWTNK